MNRKVTDIKPVALYGVFFLSGVSALLYQITWQRVLLTIHGTNIESVTIVVTALSHNSSESNRSAC